MDQPATTRPAARSLPGHLARHLAVLCAAAGALALASPAQAQFVGPGFGGGFGYGPGPFFAPPPQPYYGPPPYALPYGPYGAYGYYPRPYYHRHYLYGRYAYRARNEARDANGAANADENLGETTNGPANTAAH